MESHCFTYVVITVLIALSVSSVKTSTPCEFPAYLTSAIPTDTGGLAAIYACMPPPNGESYFHKPAGRYCDGRLVTGFIETFKLPCLSAYLDSVGTNFTHGVNFATAGSTIRPQNTTFQQTGYSPISLDVQWNEFNDFRTRSQTTRQKGGVFEKLLPKAEVFSRALYTFDISQNDLTASYFLNTSTSEVKAYVPELLNQFKTMVKNVYGQGGRYFLIHKTGPFGCLAYVLERLRVAATEMDKAGCAAPFNEVAQFFNWGLKEAVVQLRKDLPLAAITYVDVCSSKYPLFSQPKKHGFEQPLSACCGHGGKFNYNVHTGCGSKMKEILVGKACKDPSLWINWDGHHFTESANKQIFDQIVDGSFSDPPIPLKMACHREQPHS